LRLAHQSVKTKKTARTRLATLLALVSNPHAISAAPIRLEPRYPAGSVIHAIPPDILVAPPSSATRTHALIRNSRMEMETGDTTLTVELDGMDMRARENARKRVAHLLIRRLS